jgi:Predicted transcriptional regulators
VENRIRAYREAKGLSLDQLASLAGTSNQQISNLETGKRRLTADWLRSLGVALGCHPWELVGDELPRSLTPDEIQLFDSYRRLTVAQREAVRQLLTSICAAESASA